MMRRTLITAKYCTREVYEQRRKKKMGRPSMGNAPELDLPTPKPQWYGAVNVPSRDLDLRETKISELADDVFARGNQFLKNCPSLQLLPEGPASAPEVCFAGHTNAGKSSLIAALCRNSKLAKPCKQAGGKVWHLSFFNVGDCLLLCDCPGYGNWNRVRSRKNFVQARTLSATQQYIAHRKSANLKRVYFVIGAAKGMKLRDKEFAEFLMKEQVPFTIVLNKMDVLDREGRAGAAVEINDTANEIFTFFGTDKVPLIETSAKFNHNIEALKRDIVFNCARDLRDDQLTVKDMMNLGYAPAPLAEQLAVEAAYPADKAITPKDDKLTLRDAHAQHITAVKTAIKHLADQHGPSVAGRVMRQVATPQPEHLIALGVNTQPHDRRTGDGDDHLALPESMTYAEAAMALQLAASGQTTKQLTASDEQSAPEPMAVSSELSAPPAAQLSERSVSDSRSELATVPTTAVPATRKNSETDDGFEMQFTPSTAEALALALEGGHALSDAPARRTRAPSSSTAVVPSHGAGVVAKTSKPLRWFDGKRVSTADLMSAPLPVAMPTEAHPRTVQVAAHERQIPAPPASMVPDEVNILMKTEYKSIEGYRAMVDHGRAALMDSRSDKMFVTHAKDRRKGGSSRGKQVERHMHKYLDRNRKTPRAIRLDAEGYMAPTLAAHAERAGNVVGVGTAGNNQPQVGPARKMPGLRRSGTSFSPNTFKGRGSGTSKLHKWARN